MTRHNLNPHTGGRIEEPPPTTNTTEQQQQSQSNHSLSSLLHATTTNAISNGNNSNSDSTPRGIDALYHPATAGIDTLLQFQWMRINPSEVLSLPSSPMMMTTTTTTTTLKRKRDDDHHHPTTSDHINQNPTPYRISPHTMDLAITLTELFSPPLQVEWIPGLETSDESDEDETDDITTDAKRQAPEGGMEDLATCVMEAVRLADDDEDDDDDDGGCHVGRLLEQLSRVSSTEGLTNALSSRSFLSALEMLSSSSPGRRRRRQQRTKKQLMEVGLRALLLLTEHSGTEVMGGYILRVLAPVMFQFLAMSTEEDDDDDDKGTKDLTETERELIQQLAFSLIRSCRLGNLSRMELSEMMSGGSSSTSSSSAEGGGGDEGMDELRFCVGEAFFSWRESVCR